MTTGLPLSAGWIPRRREVEWCRTIGEAHGPGGQVPGDVAQAGDHRRERCRTARRLGLGLPGAHFLDARTAELARVAAAAATGAPAVCLEWSVTRALAAGATEDEITGVLLAIAPVAGLGRVVSAVPGLAIGLGYDVETALMEADDP